MQKSYNHCNKHGLFIMEHQNQKGDSRMVDCAVTVDMSLAQFSYHGEYRKVNKVTVKEYTCTGALHCCTSAAAQVQLHLFSVLQGGVAP